MEQNCEIIFALLSEKVTSFYDDCLCVFPLCHRLTAAVLLRLWSTFLLLQPFNTGHHVVLTPEHKIIFIATL